MNCQLIVTMFPPPPLLIVNFSLFPFLIPPSLNENTLCCYRPLRKKKLSQKRWNIKQIDSSCFYAQFDHMNERKKISPDQDEVPLI